MTKLELMILTNEKPNDTKGAEAMKTQKTLYIREDDYEYDAVPAFGVGDEVILVERYDTSNCQRDYYIVPHEGHGIPGNMDASICRYHGWRGETNNISRTAHGVRRIRSMEYDWNRDALRVVVGPDLHPDWE